jgi:hypothetical protein
MFPSKSWVYHRRVVLIHIPGRRVVCHNAKPIRTAHLPFKHIIGKPEAGIVLNRLLFLNPRWPDQWSTHSLGNRIEGPGREAPMKASGKAGPSLILRHRIPVWCPLRVGTKGGLLGSQAAAWKVAPVPIHVQGVNRVKRILQLKVNLRVAFQVSEQPFSIRHLALVPRSSIA